MFFFIIIKENKYINIKISNKKIDNEDATRLEIINKLIKILLKKYIYYIF